MRNIYILSKYTFKEALARKVFLTFFGISTFILLLFIVLFASVDMSAFIPADALGMNSQWGLKDGIVSGLKLLLINPLYGGGLFLSIFAASSFIPVMLEKGSIEILLSKPVSRAQIIIGKFLGVTFMVFMNITYFVSILTILIGIKFQVWDFFFFSTIFTITLAFAVLYSLIILIGIITKTSLPAMILSYLIFFILSPVLNARDAFNFSQTNSFLSTLGDILYYITPRTSELGSLTLLISGGGVIEDFSVIIHSLIYIILMLLFSIIIFNKKDY